MTTNLPCETFRLDGPAAERWCPGHEFRRLDLVRLNAVLDLVRDLDYDYLQRAP